MLARCRPLLTKAGLSLRPLLQLWMRPAKLQSMNERPHLPNYDPDFCLKVARCAAATCVGWLMCALVILIFVDPSQSRCSGWMINNTNGRGASLWVFVGMFTALPTISICYNVLRWEWFSQTFYDSAAGTYYGPLPNFLPKKLYDRYRPNPATFQYNGMFVLLNVFWSLFCTSPLWIMLFGCTNLPRYLGY